MSSTSDRNSARALWSLVAVGAVAVTMGWLGGRVSAAGASDIRVVNAVKAGDRGARAEADHAAR